MSMPAAGNQVALPSGTSIAPGRETVAPNAAGQNVPGMVYILTTPLGAQTSVFVPYALMDSPDVVAAMFAKRVAQVEGIAALGA